MDQLPKKENVNEAAILKLPTPSPYGAMPSTIRQAPQPHAIQAQPSGRSSMITDMI